MLTLTKDNFELYASKHYQANNWATTEDFKSDLDRLKYINRLINRYYRDDDLKERLILNHIIVLGNVFGPKITSELLMVKTEGPLKSIIKTFLVYLNYMPELDHVNIALDSTVVNVLREL